MSEEGTVTECDSKQRASNEWQHGLVPPQVRDAFRHLDIEAGVVAGGGGACLACVRGWTQSPHSKNIDLSIKYCFIATMRSFKEKQAMSNSLRVLNLQ